MGHILLYSIGRILVCLTRIVHSNVNCTLDLLEKTEVVICIVMAHLFNSCCVTFWSHNFRENIWKINFWNSEKLTWKLFFFSFPNNVDCVEHCHSARERRCFLFLFPVPSFSFTCIQKAGFFHTFLVDSAITFLWNC